MKLAIALGLLLLTACNENQISSGADHAQRTLILRAIQNAEVYDSCANGGCDYSYDDQISPETRRRLDEMLDRMARERQIRDLENRIRDLERERNWPMRPPMAMGTMAMRPAETTIYHQIGKDLGISPASSLRLMDLLGEVANGNIATLEKAGLKREEINNWSQTGSLSEASQRQLARHLKISSNKVAGLMERFRN